MTSLDPRWRIANIISEPLRTHSEADCERIREEVGRLLEAVGLGPEFANRFPHLTSGGQCLRIGIARALALSLKLLIADEPVSALDVSVQAQILNLLRRTKMENAQAMLFFSHDLSVIRIISDRVAVPYLGGIVETAPSETLFSRPKHPYTRMLLDAIPEPTTRRKQRFGPISGEIPSAVNPPSGRRFHPRCPKARPICHIEPPTLTSGRHAVSCHLPDKGPETIYNCGLRARPSVNRSQP